MRESNLPDRNLLLSIFSIGRGWNMMSELHLKFHSDTGTKATRKLYASAYDEDNDPTIMPDDVDSMDIPSDEYIEWLEDLAMKYLKSVKVIADANKANAKMNNVKLCFESLKSNINAIDSTDVDAYEIIQIADDCDDLESIIYD